MNPSEDNSRRPDQLIRLEPNQKQQDHTFKLDKTKQLEQAIEANSRETGDKRNMITSIQAQKRPGRYNIYLGEEYAFPVDEELIIKYMLHKGMVLSPAFQEELKVEDVSRKAYQRALNYLSYGLRSEKEVRDDLKEKEFEEQADEVIERLKEQRLIDDLEYAKSYVRTSANLNRKGPSVIQNELFRRGIDKLSIEEAMFEYSYEDQFDNAYILAEKAWKKARQKSQREAVQKVKQHLMQKGFNMDIIQEVINEMDTDKSEDEEFEALAIQGEKAWKRYSRKSSGYELVQKTKSSLFQKGYPSELIKRFTDMKEEENAE
ncbi:recombination regulator RecX [Marinilactibacillus piezotolerans]|uniref:recombination regulator RecX n=1 Tax=Marinilactibacillus piezotolerans TaxID=258723 RepID=UPI0021196A26|nr:recombination regulator RecX [Marinilactibacillus piezotolerans]